MENMTKENTIESKDLFARKCSVTGKGMNEGYCILDGMMYIENDDDIIKHLREIDYPFDGAKISDEILLDEAYNSDYYYHTEWDELDEDEAYDEDGNAYELINDLWTKI